MNRIRILLADDHELMRHGLRQLLEKEGDLEVVAEADSGRKALELAHEHAPDVVVMDVTMADLNGIVATERLGAELPEVRVLGLSMHPAVNIVGEMLRAGAAGYLTKNCAAAELVAAIRQVHRGELYLSPEISREEIDPYLDGARTGRTGSRLGQDLSAREKEVLQLVAEGRPTKAIADQLCLSEKTVGAHRQAIMEKLGLHSVAELTKYAIREGLTSLD